MNAHCRFDRFLRPALREIGSALLLGLLAACGGKTDLYPALEGSDASIDHGGKADTGLDAKQETPSAQDAWEASTPEASEEADSSEASVPTLDWGLCAGSFTGECASVAMPLDWTVPQGQTIPVYVDRIRYSPFSKAQLWLLQGGPGGSGQYMPEIVMSIADQLPEFDLYTIEHRGVGPSARLSCSQEPVPATAVSPDGLHADLYTVYQACLGELQAVWGEGLKQFNTSNAARDLAYAIELTRTPGQQVFVYGVSYGTYWAQRYLQVNPTQPSGVILDSIVPLDAPHLSRFDLQADVGAKVLAQACKEDPFCSSKLGPDPWNRMLAIWTEQQSAPCLPLPTLLDVRETAAALLQSNLLSPASLAIFYRLDRCEPADQKALTFVLEALSNSGSTGFDSDLLYFNITYSELWETPPPDTSTLLSRYQQSLLAFGVYPMHDLGMAWPLYPWDSFVRQYPQANTPVLLLNGDLDVQTPLPWAEPIASHYTGPFQTFVKIPYGNHGTIIDSLTWENTHCGAELIVDFLSHPTQPIDTSCTNKTLAPAFSDSSFAEVLFDLPDLWENPTGVPWKAPSTLTAEQQRALERVRRAKRFWKTHPY